MVRRGSDAKPVGDRHGEGARRAKQSPRGLPPSSPAMRGAKAAALRGQPPSLRRPPRGCRGCSPMPGVWGCPPSRFSLPLARVRRGGGGQGVGEGAGCRGKPHQPACGQFGPSSVGNRHDEGARRPNAGIDAPHRPCYNTHAPPANRPARDIACEEAPCQPKA